MKRYRAIDKGTVMSALRAIDLIPMGGPSQREVTQEGLVAPAHISKFGLQAYRAGELGIPGMDANKVLIAFRPENEVFDPAAMKSFELNPLANDHTPEDVSPDNWRKYASEGRIAGDIRDVGRADDQKHLGAKLIVRDKKAIEDIVGGKSQLSCGYTFDADWTPGEFEGQKYDFIQRRIRGNHVAIVDVARGGYGCRVADREPKTNRSKTMEFIPVTINGITIRVATEDSQNAFAARDAYDKMSALHKAGCDALEDVKGKFDAMKEHHKAVVGRLKEKDDDEEGDETMDSKKSKDGVTLVELVDMKVAGIRRGLKKASDTAIATITKRATDAEAKVLTDAQIEQLGVARSKTVEGARKLIGDGFKDEGKSVPAIRIEAITHVAKDAAFKNVVEAGLAGVTPDKLTAEKAADMFSMLVAMKPAQAARDGGGAPIRSILAHDGGGSGGSDGGGAADLRNPDAISRIPLRTVA